MQVVVVAEQQELLETLHACVCVRARVFACVRVCVFKLLSHQGTRFGGRVALKRLMKSEEGAVLVLMHSQMVLTSLPFVQAATLHMHFSLAMFLAKAASVAKKQARKQKKGGRCRKEGSCGG